jgi:integrase
MTISQASDLWLGELERQGHSERTIDTYRRLLDKLADAYPHIDVDELTTTHLRRFLDEQARKRRGGRKAPATIAQNVSIISGLCDWLTREGLMPRNPTRRNGDRVISRPRQTSPDENDNVVTVSDGDVLRLLHAADRSGDWGKRLTVNALAYLGSRRHAVAIVRLRDYDPGERTLTFREKSAKTIRKPVPDRLADLIDSAIASGLYESPDDYLIPGRAVQRREGNRDDRIIWRIVREVARDAGVTTHVHALRAAFAVRFLELKRNDVLTLKELMGHARIETTLVYLRRLNRRQAMETVRDLTYDPPSGPVHESAHQGTSIAPHDNYRPPQIAAKTLESLPFTEKEGFEPSMED